ncbi:hypothetical protein FB465_1711 [Kitasatospora atroaurantiaca]|uniref:Uncharacterized protein n=2 Tax=Kitasatospora atroaurantiaca TaxID=285545 RepID=A0A561EM71_9ACTN|nr:hypothetical protein FB465_1711 [Kitasatospora atroaurantiaca]
MEKPSRPSELYRALGEDIPSVRPIITGDVFADAEITEPDGTCTKRMVIILDHPCSLRTDGVTLAPRLTVAEVISGAPNAWRGNYSKMFLPKLQPEAQEEAQNFIALLDQCYHVSPAQITAAHRIACLSTVGINLLLQRRVHHFSRVVVPTFEFQKANAGVYDEVDLVEDWCLEREDHGIKPEEAAAECMAWLRDESDGVRKQELLKDEQRRSTVRQQMREHLKTLRTSA